MTSCEEEPIGGENIEQGGNENNGGENESDQEDHKCPATLNLDKVTAATAMFTGYLNVPFSDHSSSLVTVYYSDAETFNINTAESVSATSFDNQHNFYLFLTNLKYGTKYNYCMEVEVKSEKTYGEVLSFTTENVTLSDLSVTSNVFQAEFSGSVKGLTDVDKEYVKVGVLYSLEDGKVENGEGIKVDVTDISSDDTFSVLLSDLSVDTKYYFCGYVRQGNTYIYGTPAEFTTLKHPYGLSYDLNVESAIDLSFPASANCYIVSESGLYKFNPVKGNSNESVGDIASASILWETFGTSNAPCFCDIIAGVCYKDHYIAFKTADTFKKGNAVIAAKDAEGSILWSWHIWFTDQPKEQVYYNNAGTLMDRNLGATSATPGDVGALGLLYQWGRKDPFLGASSISEDVEATSTITWPSAVSSDSSTGTIEYSICHPNTFITSNDRNADWYYTGDLSTDNTRWTTLETTKSIYDPCPAGWRVSDGDRNGVWLTAVDSSWLFNDHLEASYDSNNEGINFSTILGDEPTIWYPASGQIYHDSSFTYVGRSGYYWSATPSRHFADNLRLSDAGYVYLSSYLSRASGCSVRCLQESN